MRQAFHAVIYPITILVRIVDKAYFSYLKVRPRRNNGPAA